MRLTARLSPVLGALALMWLSALLLSPAPVSLVQEYGLFSFLGITGAIFANSTGAGGGVIFVPFFKQLGFDATTTVATSFAIQCCGMTAGALTWWRHYSNTHSGDQQWQALIPSLRLTVPASLTGVLIAQLFQYTQHGGIGDADKLHIAFGVFSILLAVAIFLSLPLAKKQAAEHVLTGRDKMALVAIALSGGAITAYLSVGVGELVAVYLIMRRFNVTMAIACAVILSAATVWAAVVMHAAVLDAVHWPVVLFAGAGAIAGGMLAKYLVLFFSPANLKLFFAGWVLLLGLSALPI